MAADSCKIGDDGGYICSKYFQESKELILPFSRAVSFLLSAWGTHI
jgi:hypothetical protein